MRCHYCKKKGHFKRDCYKRKADMAKQNAGNNYHNQHKGGGGQSRQPRKAVFMASSKFSDHWLLDSAADEHYTTDAAAVYDLYDLPEPHTLSFANGTTGVAVKAGTVALQHSYTGDIIIINDVMFAPSSEKISLLSVGALTEIHGGTALFDREGATYRAATGFSITAPKYGRLYMMEDWETITAEDKGTQTSAIIMAVRSGIKPGVTTWHSRLGHIGLPNLKRMIVDDSVTGLNITARDIDAEQDKMCDPCQKGKMVRPPFPKSSTTVNGALDLLHMDLCGPLEDTRGGNQYIATYKDDHTHMSWIQLAPSKKNMAKLIKQQIQLLETETGRSVKAIRTDNGREYVNKELSSYLADKGIRHDTTMPYTPQQNGEAERLNRTLQEKVRPMLSESKLPLDMWGEAITVANYLRNVSPVAGQAKTPWELYYGTKPDLSHLRTFGCRAYVLIPKQLRTHKMAEVSEAGIMVGYATNGKGYRILMDTGDVKCSRDVHFDENTFPGEDAPPPLDPADSDSDSECDDAPEEEEEQGPQPDPQAGNGNQSESDSGTPPPSPSSSPDSPVPPPAPSRPKRPIVTPIRYRVPIGLVKVAEPLTYQEAIAREDGELWQTATDEEMTSLLENDTWEVVKKPADANIIDVKWVYKIKYDTTGNVSRYKARLVAKGYKQVEGIDYNEVFAPVSKYATIRVLLAVAAAEDLELQLLDIKTAFLNGVLEEEVYISNPPGYPQGPPGTVLRLKKTLYGLKQAPRAWHQRLDAELTKLGFTSSMSDPGLYIHTSESTRVYLMIYVDDILIASNDKDLIRDLKQELMTTFDARDMGDVESYLGMKIVRDRGSRIIKLSQGLMTKNLVEKYGMEDSKTKSTPLGLNIKLTADEGEPLDTDIYPYSQLVGSMMYLAVCTRPDIAYAVGALARFMAKPTTVHWQAAKGVLRYLSGTTDYGITFGPGELELLGYCDADFAGDTDTRRSTTGFVFLLGGGSISWSSKRQATVAVSTTEAEYMGAAAAVKEALWLRNLLSDFGLDITPVKIYGDNQSTLKLLRNPISTLRSKHIDVIYHFARERVMKGDITFAYVNTSKMLADMLTKAIPTGKHEECCKGISVGPV
jgi:hypothetical protein